MSEKLICSNCSSANQKTATVCAICRVPLDSENMDVKEINKVLETEIRTHRAEFVGKTRPGACSTCDWVYRPGAVNCKKCGEPLTSIILPVHILEELPIEGKSFKSIQPKHNFFFWLTRLILLITFFGFIGLIVWLFT